MRKRPKSEWVRSQLPQLRIVPDEVWQRVQARHVRAAAVGGNIREGVGLAGHRPGRNPAYLFSSLLKCGLCGANMSIVGGSGIWKTYGCPTRKEGGQQACSNTLTVRLSIVEDRLLAPIKRDLLSEEVIAEFRKRVARAIAARPAPPSNDARIAQLPAEIANLADAIASGALRSSKALAERLSTAEAELERLVGEKPARKAQVVNMPALLVDRYRRLVAGVEAKLSRDVHRARTMLRQLVGSEIPVVPHASGKHLAPVSGSTCRSLCRPPETLSALSGR